MTWEVRNLDAGPRFCLTPQSYENASRNQADTLRWVREAMWRLRYYRGELDNVQTQTNEGQE